MREKKDRREGKKDMQKEGTKSQNGSRDKKKRKREREREREKERDRYAKNEL